jgi:predicted RNA methylase
MSGHRIVFDPDLCTKHQNPGFGFWNKHRDIAVVVCVLKKIDTGWCDGEKKKG